MASAGFHEAGVEVDLNCKPSVHWKHRETSIRPIEDESKGIQEDEGTESEQGEEEESEQGGQEDTESKSIVYQCKPSRQ